MVNVITGFYRPQSGSVVLFGQWVGPPRSDRRAWRGAHLQNLALFRGMTVLENILLGRHVFTGRERAGELFYRLGLRNEVEHRRVVEELIDFMQIRYPRRASQVIPLGMQNA
jgi:branched-chain amino acid transport system ATP-binding protein